MRMETAIRTTAEPTAAGAPINPHVLRRQVLGLVFWAGIVPLFCGGPFQSVLCLLLGGLTFADAWVSGIYKRPDRRSLSNNSPMVWGVAMALLFVVGYPVYLINRNKLRTVAGTNVFYWAVILVGGLVLASWILTVALALLAMRPRIG